MSNCSFCDTDFDTLGTNSGTTCGATCGTACGTANDPINDLTLSTMVVGNQGVMLNKLIMILLFLYAYTNQNFISYLMCMNDKLIDNQSCLTCKLVDNLMDNLANCQGNLDDCRGKRNHNH